MGAWGPDTFENDAACDWIADLVEVHDLSVVEAAIAVARETGDDYLDVDDGCEALASCEVVARLQGAGGKRDAYSEELDAWVKAHPIPLPPELVANALEAIERVTGKDSELAELWDGDPEWQKAVADLRARVASSH
ncbi:MAG: DUF4259 domain-containing protein [Deltaproteobacteria bacterium]|nr:DUF4259 domain-containing protein [Deltaproteobacteria bacterium]